MARCNRRQFRSRERICAGNLDKFVRVEARTLAAAAIGSSNPQASFSLVKEVWCAVETIRGTRRYQGVHVREDATHLFFARYDADLLGLETGDNFLRLDSRLFKLLEVTIHAEDRHYLIVQCTERGDETRDAAEA